MLYQHRGFEHRGEAMRRTHLMPVVRDRFSRSPEPWWVSLLGWLAIGVAAYVLWGLA